MKFTISWLKDFLETDASLDQICQALTSLGLEVESVQDKVKIFEPFIVGYIKEATPHPNADRLKICQVDVGSKILQVVCGGNNARAGIKVVLAAVDTVIPSNGMKMKLSKIRDVESNGMLVSLDEMGIGHSDGGIIELPENSKIGEPFAKYMGLDEQIVEIAITPNRGDCLGVYGIARDLAAAGVGKLRDLKIDDIEGEYNSPISLKIDVDTCNEMLFRYIKNVANGESPKWLQDRLKSIGAKSISALVDITNYISFSFGRPLHVYDADKISDIVVRTALKGEKFTALNDIEYEMKAGETVISSSDKIIGLAGIIGEKDSGVTFETKNILLEVACFDPVSVAVSGRMHQIDTDARYRFERKIDQDFMLNGEKIATSMILKICGGIPSNLVREVKKENELRSVIFSINDFEKIAGFTLPKNTIIGILEGLKFKVEQKEDDFLLEIPSWRSDISIKEDLIEEILRIYGYDNIPEIELQRESSYQPILSQLDQYKFRSRRLLASIGYTELVTWSFMNSKIAQIFQDNKKELFLKNPISSELDYMRPTILPNLIEALKKNIARNFNNLSFFEVGPVFSNKQEQVVSGVRVGNNSEKNLYNSSRKFDVFDVKKDMFSVVEECGFNPDNLILDDKNLPKFLHPGRSSYVKIGNQIIGYLGELHPLINKLLDIDVRVNLFELFLEKIPTAKSKKGKKIAPKISDFQTVKRDFAFIVNRDCKILDITRLLGNIDKNIIKQVSIFDIYTGANIGEDKKSIALSVYMQSNEATLTDSEIDFISNKIIETAKNSFGAELR